MKRIALHKYSTYKYVQGNEDDDINRGEQQISTYLNVFKPFVHNAQN